MKSNSRRALQIILASVLLLMGCDVSTFILPQQIPTSNPNVVHLMVVQTAAAAATETAGIIPPTLTSTLTPFPTQTPVNSPTVTPTYIFLLATSTSTSSGTACDDAIFVSDLTIPDNTVENPGESFVKTWVLQNTGSCTWGSGYTLNFVSGTRMGGTNTSVGSLVAPGEQAQISVTMTALTTAGEYTGAWRLNNSSGKSFGETVDVAIDVNANEYTQTPTDTATRYAHYFFCCYSYFNQDISGSDQHASCSNQYVSGSDQHASCSNQHVSGSDQHASCSNQHVSGLN